MPTVIITVVAPPHWAVYTGQGRIYTGQARHLLANWGFVFTKVLFFITIYIIRIHFGQPYQAVINQPFVIAALGYLSSIGNCQIWMVLMPKTGN